MKKMFRGSRDCLERTVSSGNLGNYECLPFNSRASCSTFGRKLTSSGIETHPSNIREPTSIHHHRKIETNEKYVNKKTTTPASSQKILSWHDPANFEATVNLIPMKYWARCPPASCWEDVSLSTSRGSRSPATSRDMSRWQDPGQFFQRPRCGSKFVQMRFARRTL